jgi:cytochrome P450
MDYTKLGILSPEVRADTASYYRWLRKNDPVHWTEPGYWMITRHHDVLAVLKDSDTFSSAGFNTAANAAGFKKPPLEGTMLTTDGDVHTRLRAIANRSFNPRFISRLRPHIREITDSLLRQVENRGEMDAVDDFAVPLPVQVIAELLGVETSRVDEFKRWSHAVMNCFKFDLTDERRAEIRKDVGLLEEYLRAILEERIAHPKDDFISALAHAEEDHKRLSIDEMASTLVLVLAAGNETTTNLIGNTFVALCDNPELLSLVQEDPSKIPQMIEEVLRYSSPVQGIFRQTTRDTEVSGVKIPKDAVIHVVIGSANRDEAVFPDPDRIDPFRDTTKQIGFGYGVHHCLGAPLARLEVQVGFAEIIPRLKNLRRSAGELTRINPHYVLGGYETIPVTFDSLGGA